MARARPSRHGPANSTAGLGHSRTTAPIWGAFLWPIVVPFSKLPSPSWLFEKQNRKAPVPKSKAKRKKKAGAKQGGQISWGGKPGPGARRANLVIALLVLIGLAAGAAYWFVGARGEHEFEALAAKGQDRLTAAVISFPNRGGGHREHGEIYYYEAQFPTSGPHDPVPTSAGTYRAPQRPGQLVHALEHGNIVIYYDEPGGEVLKILNYWSGLYDGKWDGVIVAPTDGLRGDLVLTAWTKTLRLKTFDAALAAAFIDAYRGRGPEHPVR